MSRDADQIWQALPVPAFLVDAENLVAALNPAAETFLKLPQKAVVGRGLPDKLGFDIDLDGNLNRARAGQAVLFHRDAMVTRPGDAALNCDVQIAPLGDGAGLMLVLLQPRGIVGQLGKALQARSAAKTAIGMADMLAHEIKNPLAGIAGAAQLLAMGLKREDQEMTDLIVQETRRIVDLLKQVEQFGDLRKPALKPLNIHDILERARITATLGAASAMTFADDYDPSLPLVPGDGDQLQQVFLNLFANAAEAAGPGGGRITIRTCFEPGLRLGDASGGHAVPLQVEVIDDGPGIAEGLLDSVFDPFVSTRENGTGLGLALVSKIVSDHNGSITVTSQPGRTIFRISLPLAPRQKEQN
ncbi:MAG: PAS domain-containing protein [Rhodobacteraceae bacterium]|nr:PAS domain-containing protein [Paracoccaceae bacterium]